MISNPVLTPQRVEAVRHLLLALAALAGFAASGYVLSSQVAADFLREGPVRFTGLERIEEYRLYVVVALRLRDLKTGEQFWEEPNFSGDESFFVTGPRAVSRARATDDAIDLLARRVVDRIAEDW